MNILKSQIKKCKCGKEPILEFEEKENSYVGQITCKCGQRTPRFCYKKTFSDGFTLSKKTFLLHLVEQWNRHKDDDDYRIYAEKIDEIKRLREEKMNKDKWINLRCTDEYRAELTVDAEAHGMTVAEYLRYLIEKERQEYKINATE